MTGPTCESGQVVQFRERSVPASMVAKRAAGSAPVLHWMLVFGRGEVSSLF